MQYVVWVDSGPKLVTPELHDAINAAKQATGRAQVSKFVIGVPQETETSVIYRREPGSLGVEQWIDTLSQQSYEAAKERMGAHAKK